MSDKENIDIKDENKSVISSRSHSSASNISGIARSIIGHVMEDAVFTYTQEVPDRENLSGALDDAMNEEISESENTTSLARSMVGIALENAFDSLNNGEIEKNKIDNLPLEEIREQTYQISQEFDSSEIEAFVLVDRAINCAIRKLEDEAEKDKKPPSNIVEKDLSEDRIKRINLLKNEIPVSNIEWPTILKFNEDFGEKKIHEFILTWKLGDEWLYCIDYLGFLDTRYDKRHKYRVRFSIPTNRTPIPKASASVYFTIVVSKIKPSDFSVDVFYVIESTQLVHKPGEYIFCELWLRRILDQKNSLMRLIDF